MHCFPIMDRLGEFPPFTKLPFPNVSTNKNNAKKSNNNNNNNNQISMDMLFVQIKNTTKIQWDPLALAHKVIKKTALKS